MVDPSSITCPNCNAAFPMTEAIEKQMVARLRGQYEAEAAKREEGLRVREQSLAHDTEAVERARREVSEKVAAQLAEARKQIVVEEAARAKQTVAVRLGDMEQQLAEKAKLLAAAQQAQLALLQEKRALDDAKAAFEVEKARQLDAERQAIRDEAKKAALETSSAALRDLEERLKSKEGRLAEAEKAELQLRKEKIELDEQRRQFELELARRCEEIRDAAKKEKDEEFHLKAAEKDKQLDDMRQQIAELKRKSEQGSQQAQGEVLELDLEAALRRCFSSDEIEPVAKGVHGGDAIQHVRDDAGHACGTIIWESKRTKSWSDGWLSKLKDDKLAAKAQIAVIVSTALPKDLAAFDCREDVWVTPPKYAVPLASALRKALIDTGTARRAVEGRHDKMSIVYDYLSGPEFKARVGSIVEVFTTMREDLETEKRTIQKQWAKREKQLDRVLANTAGLHGDLAGIIGKSLPTIDQLELPALADAAADGA